MEKKKYILTSDCLIVPKDKENTCLAYFPLQSLIFEINKDAAEILHSLKRNELTTDDESVSEFLDQMATLGLINSEKERTPRYVPTDTPKPNKTILLTSDKCMLNCIYCYKGAEETGELMPGKIAFSAVDTIVNNAVETRKTEVEVGYHGGGEPTINWDVLTDSYDYAQRRCKNAGISFRSSICTNGMMSEKKAAWIAENIRFLAVSLDGRPEIHNFQRPTTAGSGSFEQVAQTLDIFRKYNRHYSIRMTATEHMDGEIFSNIAFMIDRFKPRTICIEPLFVCGRCATTGCRPPAVESFIDELKEAYVLGQDKNVQIYYSGNRLSVLTSRFCGVIGSNFFITPRGEVTACLEVSDKSDGRAGMFMYGEYDPGEKKFNYDLDVYRKLGTMQVYAMEDCRDCISKWHCAGDCIAKVPDINHIETSRNEYRCRINRALAQDHLERIMKRLIKETR